MKVGIVGLPQVGKTTIFNLLTRADVQTGARGIRAEAHVGVAEVPDQRVEQLAEIFRPKRVTHATVEYVDVPGLASGQGKAALEGSGRDMAAYLASLKNVDALLHVVRAFDDPNVPHPEGSVDPARDIHLFELEMIFSDLLIIEKRLERLEKDLKKTKSADLELEYSVLERYRAALEKEQPLRDLELTPEEEKRVRGFTFLSAKPILQLMNLGDSDAASIPQVVEKYGLQNFAGMRKVRISGVCGKIEAEIASLPPEDARLFMEDLSLERSGLARIVQESYSLLGLISYYTAGDPEVRAWTIPRGSTAVQAAGVIHSDFEKGFIKAEVVSFEAMLESRSFHAARSRGELRLEGKEYVVQEGDVILFRFNV